MSTRIMVNGEPHIVDAAPDTPLLYVLRNDLGLNGPKFGCGLGQCGACAAIVGGNLVKTCSTPLRNVGNDHVTTLEGLGSVENPHALQKAFIAEQAAQCGYCIPGMMMRAQALLNCDPHATDESIKAELQPHLCRCGTHMRILRAVRRAAEEMRSNTADARTGR